MRFISPVKLCTRGNPAGSNPVNLVPLITNTETKVIDIKPILLEISMRRQSVCAILLKDESSWQQRLYVINSESRWPMLHPLLPFHEQNAVAISFSIKKKIRELKIAYGTIYPRNPSTTPSKTLQRYSEHVSVLVVDTLHTCCDTLSGFFCNSYLRCD